VSESSSPRPSYHLSIGVLFNLFCHLPSLLCNHVSSLPHQFLLKVYGISSEDMDSLTFGCPRLIRKFMAPASQKEDCKEYNYDEVGLGFRVKV